jgi:pimeloyl-ACP methyl ester carboxylesterase
MSDATLEMPDGRTVGYADFGSAGDTVVLWCHGGPGSRLEAKFGAPAASALGFRIVGIDRPGYGLSTPRPGRSIEACVPDILAVADAVGADRFITVGVSTGCPYALATAAIAPDRVIGVVVACGLTDMRDEAANKLMRQTGPIGDIWDSATREQAMAFAEEQFGSDGSKMFALAQGDPDAGEDGAAAVGLSEADLAMFADPEYLAAMAETLPPMFAWGVEGYADDRLADGPGWKGFDVSTISCPVIVAHGDADTIVPLDTALHTAEVVPNADMRIFKGDGHFSVVRHVPELLPELV